MIKVEVENISDVGEVDVIVAPVMIDPANIVGWNKDSDLVIRKYAGWRYHKRLMWIAYHNPLSESEVIFEKGSRDDHNGTFNHVMFVPFKKGTLRSRIVNTALSEAHRAGLKTVLFPLTLNWLSGLPYNDWTIIKMGVLTASEIKGIDLTAIFAVCDGSLWSVALAEDLRTEGVMENLSRTRQEGD